MQSCYTYSYFYYGYIYVDKVTYCYVLLKHMFSLTLCHLNNYQVVLLNCLVLSFLHTGAEIVLVLLVLG